MMFTQKLLKEAKSWMRILMNKTIAVIGAGPSGMMAAITAAQNGATVTVFERNAKIGRKLMITGKGRCNVTNNCLPKDFIENVPSNGRFLYSAINAFTPQDTIDFFEKNGLALKTERGNRVFPESDRSLDVVDTLYKKAKNLKISIVNEKIKSLLVNNDKVMGIESELKKYDFDSVIVATGGKSYPKTGSTGDGYTFAKQAGHTITEIRPSLVPLESDDEDIRQLQGLSLKNISFNVKDRKTKKVLFKDFGELLFTHFGISGPVVLSASAHMRNREKNEYVAEIDLKPALDSNVLSKRIQRDLDKNSAKDFINSLNELLPKSIIPIVVDRSKISSRKKSAEITKEERNTLVNVIKCFTVNISGFRPIDEAIITSGGVNTKEINPKTMASKLCRGLYFSGEVIDVDAYTGGYNLQIAFSTGYLAGLSAAIEENPANDK